MGESARHFPGLPSAAIDPCLIGTWQATSERQQQDYPGIGPITLFDASGLQSFHRFPKTRFVSGQLLDVPLRRP